MYDRSCEIIFRIAAAIGIIALIGTIIMIIVGLVR